MPKILKLRLTKCFSQLFVVSVGDKRDTDEMKQTRESNEQLISDDKIQLKLYLLDLLMQFAS